MEKVQVSLPKIGSPLQFIKEARAELEKVTWPNRQQTTRLTLIVIVVSVLVSIYITSLDLFFTKIMELLVK